MLPTVLEECEHVGSLGGEVASADTNLCFSSASTSKWLEMATIGNWLWYVTG